MRLSEVSTLHSPPRALSRHGAFWWVLQVLLLAVLAVVAHSTVDAAAAFRPLFPGVDPVFDLSPAPIEPAAPLAAAPFVVAAPPIS